MCKEYNLTDIAFAILISGFYFHEKWTKQACSLTSGKYDL